MTILNYFEREKERIRDRHTGDICVVFGGEEAPACRTSREILEEINNLEGLNVKERVEARRRFEAVC